MFRSRSFDPIQILDEAKDSISSIFVASYEILSGSIDEHVRTYDIRAGRLRTDNIGSMLTSQGSLLTKIGPISSVSLSHDERVLLVSSLDNTIRLFDKDDGKLFVKYTGHKNTGYVIASRFNAADAFVVR